MIVIQLEFANDDDAKNWAEEYLDKKLNQGYNFPANIVSARKVPEQFCQCPGAAGYYQGATWGWWVHKLCNLPMKTFQNFHRRENFGFNLMPPELLPFDVDPEDPRSNSKEWRDLLDSIPENVRYELRV